GVTNPTHTVKDPGPQSDGVTNPTHTVRDTRPQSDGVTNPTHTVKDPGPLSDGVTNPTHTVKDPGPQSDGVTNPTHTVRDTRPQADGVTDTASDAQPEQSTAPCNDSDKWGIVDRLLACSNYRGQKLYKVKWRNFKKSTWEPEGNIPEFIIREFHIRKTLTGKARKMQRNK
ncbi:MAG: chromo domain-containing protein, partial [Sedimenticola sp.]